MAISKREGVSRVASVVIGVAGVVAVVGTLIVVWFGPQWRAIEYDRTHRPVVRTR